MAVTDETGVTSAWHMRGNFAPVAEEITAEDLDVEGEIPPELNGSYLRNGFNPRNGPSDHWFFGNGMVHGIQLSEGRARYRNRYVHTPYNDNNMSLMEAMMDPTASPANTNVIRHAGRILALEEAHLPWEIAGDLSTIGVYDFDGKLAGPMTAHPKICPKTGELLFFGYGMVERPYINYHRVSRQGELIQSEGIEIPNPVMMHDWNVTENFVVFMDLPLVFSMERAMAGGEAFGWQPEAGARLGVMPRDGCNDDISWYEIEPGYVVHPFNAHEAGEDIVLDVCRQPSIMEKGFDDFDESSQFWKWTIDTLAGTVKEEQMDDRYCDFPRVDDRLVGQPARYGYAMALNLVTDGVQFGTQLYKYDLGTGEASSHDFGTATRPGEPVFVPRSPDAAEDDGYVLAFVHDEPADESAFVILDAGDISAAPLAKVTLPQRVPYGAHGSWLAE